MTNVVSLNSLDDDDEEYMTFIDNLKADAVRATFLVEHKDGTVSVGCSSKERRDMVFDIYQLQEFIRSLLSGDLE